MRIGTGFDVHRFQMGQPLILGGVEIEFDRGLRAHSDGDVLLHAICDALFGALALGDIGQHFPDTDTAYAGMDSRHFLQYAMKKVHERHYRVLNLDSTVMAQQPKLSPHILEMRENIAVALDVNLDQVSVKATTTEQMGCIGRGEGIAAQAVVLLEQV